MKIDVEKAISVLILAANQTEDIEISMNAQSLLGQIYFDSNSVFKSIAWYAKAAEAGHPTSHYNLGVIYQQLSDGTEEHDFNSSDLTDVAVPCSSRSNPSAQRFGRDFPYTKLTTFSNVSSQEKILHHFNEDKCTTLIWLFLLLHGNLHSPPSHLARI